MNQQQSTAYIRAKRRVKEIKDFYNHLAVFLIVNTLIIMVVWYYDGPIWFTLFFAAGGWAIGLLAHALKTFQWNPFLSKDWEQRKMNELMNNNESNL